MKDWDFSAGAKLRISVHRDDWNHFVSLCMWRIIVREDQCWSKMSEYCRYGWSKTRFILFKCFWIMQNIPTSVIGSQHKKIQYNILLNYLSIVCFILLSRHSAFIVKRFSLLSVATKEPSVMQEVLFLKMFPNYADKIWRW